MMKHLKAPNPVCPRTNTDGMVRLAYPASHFGAGSMPESNMCAIVLDHGCEGVSKQQVGIERPIRFITTLRLFEQERTRRNELQPSPNLAPDR